MINKGAFFPGIKAVVMIAFVLVHSLKIIFLAVDSNHSDDISFAYPLLFSSAYLKSIFENSVNMDSTCSFAADLKSNANTMHLDYFQLQ